MEKLTKEEIKREQLFTKLKDLTHNYYSKKNSPCIDENLYKDVIQLVTALLLLRVTTNIISKVPDVSEEKCKKTSIDIIIAYINLLFSGTYKNVKRIMNETNENEKTNT